MPGTGMGGMMGRWVNSGSAWPTGLPLRRLDALANTSPVADEFEGALIAAPYLASLVSGHTTELWGYNEAFPGPLIELREGQRVTIDFANRLGLDSTIHWHGLQVPADQDGSPMDPVAPGADRLYTFEVPMGSAGTYWYHPHAHRTTTLQVGHGLAAPAHRAQRRRSAGDASRGHVDDHVAHARPERAGDRRLGSDVGHGDDDDDGRRRIAGERAEGSGARDDAGRYRALADHQCHPGSLPAPRARRSPLCGRRYRWRLTGPAVAGLDRMAPRACPARRDRGDDRGAAGRSLCVA